MHQHEIDYKKVKTISDIKIILKSLGIKYTDEALNKDLKKLIK